MQEQLTTRQVAHALNVSESSVKRWCDRGLIPTTRTLGGHRRVPLAGFVKFLEETNREVATPIPGVEGLAKAKGPLEPEALAEQRTTFREALKMGDEDRCREVLSDWYSHHGSFALMVDEYIATALTDIGEAWDCGDLEVYQERRACEICARLLYEFRRLIPEPPENAPLAMGGTPEGDHYSLATQAVEIVLRECNWRSVNLGPNLPFETLLSAALEHRPRMLWLSVSHIASPEEFIKAFQTFAAQLPQDIVLTLGGRALNDSIRPQLKFTGYCDTMRQLSSFSTAMHGKRHSLNASEN